MDPDQFLKCISFISLDRIIIYWNKLYDLRKLVGLPVNKFSRCHVKYNLLHSGPNIQSFFEW